MSRQANRKVIAEMIGIAAIVAFLKAIEIQLRQATQKIRFTKLDSTFTHYSG